MNSKHKILLADDEQAILKIYSTKLEAEGHEVICACDGEDALAKFYENQSDLDLVVLDHMMPYRSGEEVCKEIKRINRKIPVVMLTALDSEDDQMDSIDYGADDHISKSESPRLIVGKIVRQLGKIDRVNGDKLIVGDVCMDLTNRLLLINDKEIRLSAKEWDLLRYLMENAESPLSREQLIKSVWNYEYFEDTRTLDTHIKKLRKLLGPCAGYIQTIWAYGYRFSENTSMEGRMIYNSSMVRDGSGRR